MSIKDLIKAADNYSDIPKRKQLIDAKDEDCAVPGNFRYDYGAQKAHLIAEKQAYDEAEKELAAALDTYIEKRVEAVLKEYGIGLN